MMAPGASDPIYTARHHTHLSVALLIALAAHVAVVAGIANPTSQPMVTAAPRPITLRIALAEHRPASDITQTTTETPPKAPPPRAPQTVTAPVPRPTKHTPHRAPHHLAQQARADAQTPPIHADEAAVSQSANPEPAAPSTALVAELSNPVSYRNNPSPIYPMVARRQGLAGTVRLAVVVDTTGMPLQIAIRDSSGYSVLDEAARDTVQRWRFEPARRAGQALVATVEVPVRFQLEEP